MTSMDVVQFVRGACEASIYFAPKDIGLTMAELVEVGQRLGFGPGEVRDTTNAFAKNVRGSRTRFWCEHMVTLLADFDVVMLPDPRNRTAFEIVRRELTRIAKEEGRSTRVPRSVIVNRAIEQGVSEHDAEVTVTCLVLSGALSTTEDGSLSVAVFDEVAEAPHGRPIEIHGRKALLEAVRSVIAARSGDTRQARDPLREFEKHLDKLGMSRLRQWWRQTSTELGLLVPGTTPVAACVMSAALVEAALAFCVKFSRERGLAPFGARMFANEPPTRWHIDDLVNGAAQGPNEILDAPTKNMALMLGSERQRIHGGRWIVPDGGIPAVDVASGKRSVDTATKVVECIVTWLEKNESAPLKVSTS